MKTTGKRSTYTARGLPVQAFSIQKFVRWAFPLLQLIFFKSILWHKNWLGGGELLLKNVHEIATPTNHVIARAGLTLSWAASTLGFLQYFPAKYRWRPKKVLPFERVTLGTVPYVTSVPGYCTSFMKRFDEGLSYQLLGLKPLISFGLYV